MAGGLLQLVYTGKQDDFLTTKPHITFFKIAYCKYSMFAIQDHFIQSETDIGFNKKTYFKLRHYGDLLFRPYLRVTLPDIAVTYDKTVVQYLKLFNVNKKIKNTNINIVMSKLNAIMHNYDQDSDHKKVPIFINNQLSIMHNYEDCNINENNKIFSSTNFSTSNTITSVASSSYENTIKNRNTSLIPSDINNRNIYYSSYNINYLTTMMNNINFSNDIIITNKEFFEIFKLNLYNFITSNNENKFLYSVLKNNNLFAYDMTTKNITINETNELEYSLDYVYSPMTTLYVYENSPLGKTFKGMFFVVKSIYSNVTYTNDIETMHNLYEYLDEDINSGTPGTYYISNGYNINKKFNITKILDIQISGETNQSYDISFNMTDLNLTVMDPNVIYMIFPDNLTRDQGIIDGTNMDTANIEDYYDLYFTNASEYNQKIFNNDNILLPLCVLKYNSSTGLFDKFKLKTEIDITDFVYIYEDVIIFDKQSQKNNFVLINNTMYEFTDDTTKTQYTNSLYITNPIPIINSTITMHKTSSYLLDSNDGELTFVDKFNSDKSYFTQDFTSPYQILIDVPIDNFNTNRMRNIIYTKSNTFDLDYYTNLNFIKSQISSLNHTKLAKKSIIYENMSSTLADNSLYIKNLFEIMFNDLVYFKFYNQYQISSTSANILLTLRPEFKTNFTTKLFSNQKINGIDNYYNSLQYKISNIFDVFIDDIETTYLTIIRHILSMQKLDGAPDMTLLHLLNNVYNNDYSMIIEVTSVSETVYYTEDTTQTSSAIPKSKIYFELNDAYLDNDFLSDLSNNLNYSLPMDDIYYYVPNMFYDRLITQSGTSSSLYFTPFTASANKLFYIFTKLINMPIDANGNYPITTFYVLPNDIDITTITMSTYSFIINRSTQNVFTVYDNISDSNTRHLNDILYENTIGIKNYVIDFGYILYHYAFYLYTKINDSIFSSSTTNTNDFTKFNDIKMYENLWNIKQTLNKKEKNGNVSSLIDLNAAIGGSVYYFDCNICFANYIDHELINNSLQTHINEYIRLYIKPVVNTLLSGKKDYFNYFVKSYNLNLYVDDDASSLDINIKNQNYTKLIKWYFHFLNSIISDVNGLIINFEGIDIFSELTLIKVATITSFFDTSSNVLTDGVYKGTVHIFTEADYNLVLVINKRINGIINHIKTITQNIQITLPDGQINIYTENVITTIHNNVQYSSLTLDYLFHDLVTIYSNEFYEKYKYKTLVTLFYTLKKQYINMYDTIVHNIITNGSYTAILVSKLSQHLNFHIIDYEKQLSWYSYNNDYDPDLDILQFKTNTSTLIDFQDYYKFVIMNNAIIDDDTSLIRKHFAYDDIVSQNEKLIFDNNFYLLQILYENVSDLIYNFNKFFNTSFAFYSDYRIIYVLYFYLYQSYTFTYDNHEFTMTFHATDNTDDVNIITNDETDDIYHYSEMTFSINNFVKYSIYHHKFYDLENKTFTNYEHIFTIDPITFISSEAIYSYSETDYLQIINNHIYDPLENILFGIEYDKIYDLSLNEIGSYHDNIYTINDIIYKYEINERKQQILYANYAIVPIINETVVINSITYNINRNIFHDDELHILFTFIIPKTDIDVEFPHMRLIDYLDEHIVCTASKIRTSILKNDTNTDIGKVFTDTFTSGDSGNDKKSIRYLQETVEKTIIDTSFSTVTFNKTFPNNLLNNILKNSLLPSQNYINDTIICSSFNNWKDEGNSIVTLIPWLINYNQININIIKIFNQTDQTILNVYQYADIIGKVYYFIPDRFIYAELHDGDEHDTNTHDIEHFQNDYVSSLDYMLFQNNILKELGGTTYADLEIITTKTNLVKQKIIDLIIEDINNGTFSTFYESNVYFDISNDIVTWDNDINNISSNSVFIRNSILIDYDEYMNMKCIEGLSYTLEYIDNKFYLQDQSNNLFIVTLSHDIVSDVSYNDCILLFGTDNVLIDVHDSIFPKTLNIYNGNLYRYNTFDHGFSNDLSGNLIYDFKYDVSLNILLKSVHNYNYDLFNGNVREDISCSLTDVYIDFSNNYLSNDESLWSNNVILDDTNLYGFIDSTIMLQGNYVVINDQTNTFLAYVTFGMLNTSSQNLIKLYMHDTFVYDANKTYTIQYDIKPIIKHMGTSKLWYKSVFYFWETFIKSLNEIKTIVSKFDDKYFIDQKFSKKSYINKLFTYVSELGETSQGSKLFESYIDHFERDMTYNVSLFNSIDTVKTFRINLDNLYRNFKLNVYKLQSIIARDVIPKCSWIDYIGHYLFNKIGLKIDGNTLEEIDSQIIHIYNLRNSNDSTIKALYKMIGHNKELLTPQNKIKGQTLYIPLPLCFTDCTKAFPLIAMINSALTLDVEIRDLNSLVKYPVTSQIKANGNIKVEFSGSYVYLDTEMRKKFARSRHEYLYEIKQNYKYDITSNKGSIMLDYDNPCKEMLWFYMDQAIKVKKDLWNYTGKSYKLYDPENVFYNDYSENDDMKAYIKNLLLTVEKRTGLDLTTIININALSNVDINRVISYIKRRAENPNPFINSALDYNGHNRFDLEGNHTGLVCASEYYKDSFTSGLNAKSYARYPKEIAHSGYNNHSLCKDMRFRYELNKENVEGDINIIVNSYMIVKIASGMAVPIW